jgi:hypothetical protein
MQLIVNQIRIANDQNINDEMSNGYGDIKRNNGNASGNLHTIKLQLLLRRKWCHLLFKADIDLARQISEC